MKSLVVLLVCALSASAEITIALKVPVKGDTYQRVSFEARTLGGPAFQAVNFTDEAGQVFLGCWDLAEGGDWKPYDRIFYVPPRAREMRVIFDPAGRCFGRNVIVREVSSGDYLAWHKSVLETLPKTDFKVGGNPLAKASRTMDALRSGRPWRVVLLGDSIAGDTFNSGFEAMVKRRFPQSNVTWILSNRNATGCWHYAQPENFQAYVAAHRPDCLIIAGISNWRKPEMNPTGGAAIEIVGRRAAAELGAEVIVMTPTLSYDLRPGTDAGQPMDRMTFDPAQHGNPVLKYDVAAARELIAVCDRNGWPLLDMYAPVYSWLFESGLPYRRLSRDGTHSNTLGKQVIAELVDAYLAAVDRK